VAPVTASVILLVLGMAALVCVANALRPSGSALLLLPSWFTAWITIELAPQLLVLDALAAGALAALGALEHLTGWIGLAGLVVANAAAIPRIVQARRTVIDLGEVTRELDPVDSASPYPRAHIAFPFLMLRRRGVRRVGGVEFARYGRLRLKLDVYMPSAPRDGPRPAVVQVHGGGWIMGSRREQGIALLSHLAANGWVGFNADYRLSPRATFPDHIVDVKRAIAWVREHAGEYGVDPSFIAITGGSAGGHLSALAALTVGDPAFQPGFEEADTSVAAGVPFYGVYDLLDDDGLHLPVVGRVLQRLVFKANRRDHPERFRAASPIHRVHPDAPPMFVVHGTHDSMIRVDSARRFVARLREVSREQVLYAEMKGGQHAFDLVPSWRSVPVIEAVERFLWTVHRRRSGAAPSVERELTAG
jgi:acetyl esterase/lipase